MLTKKQKYFFLFSFLLGVMFISGFIFLSPQSPFDVGTGQVYIRGNDVIKNFKFDSFNNQIINNDGTIEGNTRLYFDKGSFGTATKDDFQIMHMIKGDKAPRIFPR